MPVKPNPCDKRLYVNVGLGMVQPLFWGGRRTYPLSKTFTVVDAAIDNIVATTRAPPIPASTGLPLLRKCGYILSAIGRVPTKSTVQQFEIVPAVVPPLTTMT
jgi:hypothetical protein